VTAYIGSGTGFEKPVDFIHKDMALQPCLDTSAYVNHSLPMQRIRISSKVDEDTWNELKALAAETHRNVSGLLTGAIRDYVQGKRVLPVVLSHVKQSMAENEALGKLLAN